MNIDIQKWSPWNWFKKEDEEHGRSVPVRNKSRASVPSLYGQHPLSELHREMDQLFDRAFQNFGQNFGMPSISQPYLRPAFLRAF